MIAACPKCKARYRVDETRIGAEGVRLKCAKCKAVFRVRIPTDPTADATPPPAAAPMSSSDPALSSASDQSVVAHKTSVSQPAQASSFASSATSSEMQRTPLAGEGEVVDRERLVLIADSDVESGKQTASMIQSWGLQPILVHDGVEAMLTIQRMLPRVVVLDAALPKMYGFQVCEVVKRNESLRDTGVVLIGAIHNRDRYRRPPAELYGADHYLEHPDLPEGLEPILIQLGLNPSLGEARATPAPPPEVRSTPQPISPVAPSPTPPLADNPIARAPTPPAPESFEVEVPAPPAPRPVASPAVPVDGEADERAKAERLARIVVSDIILYQPDKFSEAVRQGNVVEAMDSEIGEGRVLFRQRIDEQVREERDFIVDELVRVARERGMK